MVQTLTVHEAMSGHYLQAMQGHQFIAPTMVRAIFRSGTFGEGCDVDAEQVMAEQGSGGAVVSMQLLKLKRRTIINAIIDQQIHTAMMTEQEAISLMIEEGFQEAGAAAKKWRRAWLSSAQLWTYYIGGIEMNGIRRAHQATMGNQVEDQRMHDLRLSFGLAAPKYVTEMMG